VSRYFGRGRGVTFYVWTSDQHTHYATRVVRTTLRDATYVLDGILDNQTELPIEKHTPTPPATQTSSSRCSTCSACSSRGALRDPDRSPSRSPRPIIDRAPSPPQADARATPHVATDQPLAAGDSILTGTPRWIGCSQ